MIYSDVQTITPDVLKSLIDKSEHRRAEMKKLYERYKGSTKGVPILTRKYMIDNVEQTDKINNKLANDFFSEIIDMKVGFLAGIPISYMFKKENYSESEAEKVLEEVRRFNLINSISDLDSETTKMASSCGYAGRLFYYDSGEVRAMLINPWEIIFLGESMDEPKKSIRVYSEGENEDKTFYANVYDDSQISYYERKDKDEKFKLIRTENHIMPFNPLIGFANNAEYIGDAEKVLTLIDGYDRTVSDINSELEQWRLSYLAVYGADITAETLKAIRQSGAFTNVPVEGKIEFITKLLNDVAVENHLNRVERNIYRFSQTPNMNDAAFAGDLSGQALKFKFRSFEDKCTKSELKFKKALRQQYKILSSIWNEKGASVSIIKKAINAIFGPKPGIDYLDFDFVFTRKYPQNLMEEIDFLIKSKGIIPQKLAYSLVSFIEDPDSTMEEMEEEQQASIDEFLSQNKGTDETGDGADAASKKEDKETKDSENVQK